ncbi:hypothetical protein Thimo_3588 [Thioflavicoccus mobilis 8321]|uniref:Uncharacterized protein n=1 Tax=Thioflavicoccus mobilis 8321 TaxID=765912 RepID=L0H3S7_9GAMM|nr:hypothetical protein Thimo_3588 [Thioflavicoccus mobilis 8321]
MIDESQVDENEQGVVEEKRSWSAPQLRRIDVGRTAANVTFGADGSPSPGVNAS